MQIFVSNISFDATNDDLFDLFSEYGHVESAKIITDRESGRSRGFGFIDMSDEDAQKAIDSLDNAQFMHRALKVQKSRPKERSGGGGGYRNNRW